MNFALNVNVDLYTTSCPVCGIPFAGPSLLIKTLRAQHGVIYCPSGHQGVFHGETEVEKYKRLYENEQQKLKLESEAKERQARLLKNTSMRLANLKKRAAAGVCPCCQRTVSQMARHMATKHPDFQTQDIGKEGV